MSKKIQQNQAGKLTALLQQKGIKLPYNTALEIIAKLGGFRNLHAAQAASPELLDTALTALKAFVGIEEGDDHISEDWSDALELRDEAIKLLESNPPNRDQALQALHRLEAHATFLTEGAGESDVEALEEARLVLKNKSLTEGEANERPVKEAETPYERPLRPKSGVSKNFDTVLEVPGEWSDLLAIESFDGLPEYPDKSHSVSMVPNHPGNDGHQGVRNNYPKPLRDDQRTVFFKEAGYIVSLTLHSGNENYWTSAEVIEPNQTSHATEEPSFDLSDEEVVQFGALKFTWKIKVLPKTPCCKHCAADLTEPESVCRRYDSKRHEGQSVTGTGHYRPDGTFEPDIRPNTPLDGYDLHDDSDSCENCDKPL